MEFTELFNLYQNSKTWAFEEAFKIFKKIEGKTPKKGYVLFETGYGPSGLPHIGTFGEVVRTCFVEYAFKLITNNKIPTKIFCVSDDLDGLRKVPDNVPNKEEMKLAIGLPLSKVPDPFQTHESYGYNMNARLRGFLDSFGFKYEFISATDYYSSGKMNEILLGVVNNYEKIMDLMLKNLGEERSETYSPIMPISNITGKVLAEGVQSVNKEKGTVTYKNENGEIVEVPVTNGTCKLQWKVDFGGRWAAFDVDYEIFGKEHAPNAPIYQQICKILGGNAPINFVYELFLGEDGAKISKSKGNGISVEQWLEFAPSESLKLFMYQKPKTAKRLFFDTIPKMVDEYIKYIKAYGKQTEAEKLENPAHFIHFGNVPEFNLGGVDYTLLLHLVSAASPENEDVLWKFIQKYNPELEKGKIPFMDSIISSSMRYFEKFIKPLKKFREATEVEKQGFFMLSNFLEKNNEASAEEIQNEVYRIGTELKIDLKNWFAAIYQVLLGSNEGPRAGTFIKLYGTNNMVNLISQKVRN